MLDPEAGNVVPGEKFFNATFVHEIPPPLKISTQVIMTGDVVGDGGVGGKLSLGTGIGSCGIAAANLTTIHCNMPFLFVNTTIIC